MSLTASKNLVSCQFENQPHKYIDPLFKEKSLNIFVRIFNETIAPIYDRVVIKIKEKRQNDLVLYHNMRAYVTKLNILSNGPNRLVS